MQFLKAIGAAITKYAQLAENTADVANTYCDSWKSDAFSDLKESESETTEQVIARMEVIDEYCNRKMKSKTQSNG